MATLEIRIVGTDESGSKILANLNKELGQTQSAGEKAAASVDKVGKTLDKSSTLGRQDVTRSLAGGFVALDAVLNTLGPKLDANTQKAIGLAKSVTEIGVAASFGGPLAAGLAALGIAIGVADVYFQEQRDKIANVIAVSDPYIQKIQAMTDANQSLFSKDQLAQIDTIQKKIIDLKANTQGAFQLQDLIKFGQLSDPISFFRAMDAAEKQAALDAKAYEGSLTALVQGVISFQNAIQNTANSEAIWLAQNNNFDVGLKQDAIDAQAAADAMAAFNSMQGQQYITDIAGPAALQWATELATESKTQGQLDAENYKKIGEKWIADNTAAATAWDAKFKANEQAIIDAVKNMTNKALQPTAVTAEDMATARAGGQTPRHWDEFARQAEAVAKGTDPAKYKGFSDQLASLGMTAEQAAAGFRDFSLFADPANIDKAINPEEWKALTDNVGQQLQSMIGQANLTSAAFDKVWASLSPTDIASLAKLYNVNPADTANLKNLVEAGADPKAAESAKTTQQIADNIAAITGTHISIIDVNKSDKFDTKLDEIISDLNKIPNAIAVAVTISYNNGGSTDTSGGGGGGGGASEQAGGGWGIAQGHQVFIADPGEKYWFGGAHDQTPFPKQFLPSGADKYFGSGGAIGRFLDSEESVIWVVYQALQKLGLISGRNASYTNIDQVLAALARRGYDKSMAYEEAKKYMARMEADKTMAAIVGLPYMADALAMPSANADVTSGGGGGTSYGDMFAGATINLYPKNYAEFERELKRKVQSAQRMHG